MLTDRLIRCEGLLDMDVEIDQQGRAQYHPWRYNKRKDTGGDDGDPPC